MNYLAAVIVLSVQLVSKLAKYPGRCPKVLFLSLILSKQSKFDERFRIQFTDSYLSVGMQKRN